MQEPLIGLFSEASVRNPRATHRDHYSALVAQMELADTLGYDFYATTQSYGLDFAESTFSVSPSPVALFANAAARTRQIKFMSAITIAPLHHPAIVASEYAALDVLSGGRAMIGIGRGHPWLYERLGYDQSESRERMAEFCTTTRRLLDGQDERLQISGKFWSVRDFELLPRFVQDDPPVYMAYVSGPPSIEIAVQSRFGLIIPSYLLLPLPVVLDGVNYYAQRHQELWGSRGRWLLGVHFHARADAAQAREVGARSLAGQMEVFGRNMRAYADSVGEGYAAYRQLGDMFSEFGDPAHVHDVVMNEFPQRFAIWGDRKACLERFEVLIDAVRPSGLLLNVDAGCISQEDIHDSMRYAATQILPAVRDMLRAGQVKPPPSR
jgi:alkanesulfonate monooxygenase SsuD/methylene tetrahydromethanopterin reductase-like flavin-dependent oxidoreductase (luciferase family)